MKIYRYMSFAEFQKMSTGMDMFPFRNNFQARTTSKGFCFLGEITTFVSSYYGEDAQEISFSPEQCHQFLYGIVCDDILVEFEVDENLLQKTIGEYSDPIYEECNIIIDEYCTKTYNRDNFIPLRYAIQDGVYSHNFVWYNFN